MKTETGIRKYARMVQRMKKIPKFEVREIQRFLDMIFNGNIIISLLVVVVVVISIIIVP